MIVFAKNEGWGSKFRAKACMMKMDHWLIAVEK